MQKKVLERHQKGWSSVVRQKQCGPLLPVELKNLALSNCALAANSVSIADTDCVSDSADWYFGHSVHGCEVMKRAVTVLLLFLDLFGNSYWALLGQLGPAEAIGLGFCGQGVHQGHFPA